MDGSPIRAMHYVSTKTALNARGRQEYTSERLRASPETCRIARAAFPRGNVYTRMCDELGTIDDDRLFAALFPPRGQPAESPWRLALATVMQFAAGLSDRQAAGPELHPEALKTVAAPFLRHLIAAIPYKTHTVLTDNGIRPSTRFILQIYSALTR
jgi:hypothetical protein